MPIYEYACQNCGHQMEVLQKIADAPLTQCPECQQSTLTKLISAAGFRLSGGGWYETDFKGDTDKKRNLTQPDTNPNANASTHKDDAGKKETKPNAIKSNETTKPKEPKEKNAGSA